MLAGAVGDGLMIMQPEVTGGSPRHSPAKASAAADTSDAKEEGGGGGGWGGGGVGDGGHTA